MLVEDVDEIIDAPGSGKHADGLPNGFLRGIAEDPLRRTVPVRMMPLRSLLMIASSEESTIAARRRSVL